MGQCAEGATARGNFQLSPRGDGCFKTLFARAPVRYARQYKTTTRGIFWLSPRGCGWFKTFFARAQDRYARRQVRYARRGKSPFAGAEDHYAWHGTTTRGNQP